MSLDLSLVWLGCCLSVAAAHIRRCSPHSCVELTCTVHCDECHEYDICQFVLVEALGDVNRTVLALTPQQDVVAAVEHICAPFPPPDEDTRLIGDQTCHGRCTDDVYSSDEAEGCAMHCDVCRDERVCHDLVRSLGTWSNLAVDPSSLDALGEQELVDAANSVDEHCARFRSDESASVRRSPAIANPSVAALCAIGVLAAAQCL